MDILDAKTEWVDNRCYRLIPVRGSSTADAEKEDNKYLKPLKSTFIEDELDDPDLPIIHAGNRFYITIHCPLCLKKFIKGPNGTIRRRLQQNGSEINFAGEKTNYLEITISGPSNSIVSATYYQIQSIMTEERLRKQLTHFISLPINSPEIVKSFNNFKEDVLSKFKGVRGIHESIFQTPGKLHMTIAPLVLLDERDIEQAESVLNKCVANIMENFGEKQFTVGVKGVEYMNDDPSEVDVLYAKLHEKDEDTSLQVVADKIMSEFVAAKLSKDQYEKVKLHITLMNTTFRHISDVDKTSRRVTFDARPILKDYVDYNFGQITISEIHISILYTTDSDGYYKASCKKKLK